MDKMEIHRSRIAVALTVLAFLLLAASSVNIAYSYFTAYTEAKGYHKVFARSETEFITEMPGNLTKRINIKNSGTHECWARVLIIYPDGYSIFKTSGTGWADDPDKNGYWVYNEILPAGASASQELMVSFKLPENLSEEEREKLQFNVAVISECVPVLYNADGTPKAPEWDLKFAVEDKY